MPHPLSEFVGKWKGDDDEEFIMDIPQSERSEEYETGFRNGFQTALKTQWIKCSEQLPENKSVVLVVNREGEMAVCKIDINVNNYIFMLNDTSLQIKNVTHWQLLPESPEELK